MISCYVLRANITLCCCLLFEIPYGVKCALHLPYELPHENHATKTE